MNKKVILLFLLTCFSLSSFATLDQRILTIEKRLAELELTSGGRIGISATDTANNRRIQYRADERFATGCTSKLIGVAAVLKKSMTDSTLLKQKVMYTKSDLANWAPITEKHFSDGMTMTELSAAAISYSDNTAMNLLLRNLGGVQGMNIFARSINDKSFRQDHGWPEEAMSGGPNDIRDSSTPAAMEKSLRQIALGNVLAPFQRDLIISWLKNNTTGKARIRAGVPKGWAVGDKTGTGFYYGITNDIGIIWPPKCKPIVIVIYYTGNNKKASKREDVIASATRILVDEFAQTNHCLYS